MIWKNICTTVFLFLLVSAAYAQEPVDQNGVPDQGRQEDQGLPQAGGLRNGPPRIPPQFASDACKGKDEGAACTVSMPDGDRSGVCAFTPPDKKYFACKPDGMRKPPAQGEQP